MQHVAPVIHQLDAYAIDHETLESVREVTLKAIRRLRTSPAEEARAIGEELEAVYLDLSAVQRRNCDLVELWGKDMVPPELEPRQVPQGELYAFPPKAAANPSSASEA